MFRLPASNALLTFSNSISHRADLPTSVAFQTRRTCGRPLQFGSCFHLTLLSRRLAVSLLLQLNLRLRPT